MKENKGIDVDIFDLDICKWDEKVNEYLCIGKILGCFYIESLVMWGLFKKFNCNNYEMLVVVLLVICFGVV